jgi:hypothetical protein
MHALSLPPYRQEKLSLVPKDIELIFSRTKIQIPGLPSYKTTILCNHLTLLFTEHLTWVRYSAGQRKRPEIKNLHWEDNGGHNTWSFLKDLCVYVCVCACMYNIYIHVHVYRHRHICVNAYANMCYAYT